MQTPQKSPSISLFEQRKSSATRQEEVAGIRAKFPNKIPVRFHSLTTEQFLPVLDKTQFLGGPQGLTVTQCLGIIRSPMVLRATEAFHLLVNHRSVASVSVTVAEIYRDCKDEDGFVYMTCASQEVFGGLGSAATSWGQTLPSSPVCVDTVLGWLHQSRQPPPVCGGWSRQGRLQ
ncbi:LOW QUALITY PROTEIN: microtubule-associated proteins 1A/1B light chain 3C [Equus asinus]|uniref:LOW QUALITY PROTEIN: microtubule-associated proteins 1A/1B light chain 3C n=1 Tax=Equus asinus TaxID=9793 RepID=UPI0038F75342